MSHPPYHLRVNKAADRFALIEAIRRLPKLGSELKEYTYYGLGGPYLEDMRLLYEFYPEIPTVSVEVDGEILKRQEFHRPCASSILQLEQMDMGSYIKLYEPNDGKCIFWLDYTDLEYSCFDDFITLLTKVVPGSMVKVTLRAAPRDYWYYNAKLRKWIKRKDKVEEFHQKFSSVLPNQSAYPSWAPEKFAFLLQQMLRIAAQQALPAQSTNLAFYPVSSFFYSDGTWMFTLTGVVWDRYDNAVEQAFNVWGFANLTWARPRLINIPDLSTRERLQLQHCLPCGTSAGAILQAELDYLIDEDVPKTEDALEQYAAFHRYFPYFLRGVP